ncbi:MAG: hypothetical protein JSW58_09475 [Candidatus Latescibacterota bacterium]|nr:MAG: hypothetical protein JSW58_09475 [Candidatus Latescibacterota bacterium]
MTIEFKVDHNKVPGMDAKKELDIVVREYELHRGELRARLDHRVHGIGVLLTTLFIVFGLGVRDERLPEVCVVVPWFLIGAAAFFGHQVMCATLTISYLKDLERRIGVLDYQRGIEPTRHSAPLYRNPYKILYVLMFVPLLLVFGFSLWRSHEWLSWQLSHPSLVWVYHGSAVVLLALVFAMSVWGCIRNSHLREGRDHPKEAKE